MSALIQELLLTLTPFIRAILFKTAVMFGIGVSSYIGFGLLLAEATTLLAAQVTGLPAQMAAMAYLLGIDRCINLLLSAVSTRSVLLGLTGAGVFSKVTISPPAA